MVVSCGVRLSEVGFAEFPKPQVARSGISTRLRICNSPTSKTDALILLLSTLNSTY